MTTFIDWVNFFLLGCPKRMVDTSTYRTKQ